MPTSGNFICHGELNPLVQFACFGLICFIWLGAVLLLHLVVSSHLMSSVNTSNIANMHIMAETGNVYSHLAFMPTPGNFIYQGELNLLV